MSAERGTAHRPAPPHEAQRPATTAAAGPRQGALTQLAAIVNHGPAVQRLTDTARSLAPNRTGLPDRLKSGIESLSGLSMDHVRVHYNSARPAAIQAHAYAQGTNIHLAPGQERHLPHEAWHVVQQAQGRVKPTTQAKMADGADAPVSVNDDPGLESEADRMGALALSQGATTPNKPLQRRRFSSQGIIQRGKNKRKKAPYKKNAHMKRRELRDTDSYREKLEKQDLLLRSVTRLYVNNDENPSAAYKNQSKSNPNEILVDRDTVYPRHNASSNGFSATFSGTFYKYHVQLLEKRSDRLLSLDHINNSDSNFVTRLISPFTINKTSLRSDGTAMGRPIGGSLRWGINPSYKKAIGHLDSDDENELKNWAINIAKLPQHEFYNQTLVPFGMTKLKSPETQPFVFYINNNTPLNNQSVNNALNTISASDFDAKYIQNLNVPTFKYLTQSANSFPPKKDRQTDHRDPGTTMGTSAWKLAQNGAPGKAGKLSSHEWCHLVGDGDGGRCAPENLVIGTNAVNTEQLAMENALRPWRKRLVKVQRAIQIKASALADEKTINGKEWNYAIHILYELTLVDTQNGNLPIPIIRHSMDGQRGAITMHEYDVLNAIVDEKIQKIVTAEGWMI